MEGGKDTVDPLQALKAMLDGYIDSMGGGSLATNGADRHRVTVAKILSQLIGNGKVGEFLDRELAAYEKMTPQQFDTYVEAFERENKASIADEFDRYAEKIKQLLSRYQPKGGAVDDILREILSHAAGMDVGKPPPEPLREPEKTKPPVPPPAENLDAAEDDGDDEWGTGEAFGGDGGEDWEDEDDGESWWTEDAEDGE
jgi:hypothetical protein